MTNATTNSNTITLNSMTYYSTLNDSTTAYYDKILLKRVEGSFPIATRKLGQTYFLPPRPKTMRNMW